MPEVEPRALRTFVERLERLTEEGKLIADDIENVFVEASAAGLNRAALQKLLALRGDETALPEERRLFLEYAAAMERE